MCIIQAHTTILKHILCALFKHILILMHTMCIIELHTTSLASLAGQRLMLSTPLAWLSNKASTHQWKCSPSVRTGRFDKHPSFRWQKTAAFLYYYYFYYYLDSAVQGQGESENTISPKTPTPQTNPWKEEEEEEDKIGGTKERADHANSQ